MSNNPQGYGPQGYGPQGYGPQGYGPPPQNPYGVPSKSGMSTTAIVLIVVGVVMVGGLMVCGILAGLLLPAVQAARDAARRMSDQNNLKQIGLGFHNYESAFKVLPAPAAANASGQKVWSWSISLLPFCEEQQKYQQIDFGNMQPWDSPEAPPCFREESPRWLMSSRTVAAKPNDCQVYVISAPTKLPSGNPIFIDGQYTSFGQVRDGLSNTILAIMLTKHSTPWASPTTLTADQAYQLIQNENRIFSVLMADGRVVTLPTTINQISFNALVTRDGGEAVNIDSLAGN